jgi:hypothetical protein
MYIEQNQQVLLTNNVLLTVKDIEKQEGIVYGKSVSISTQQNKVDWSGNELAVSDISEAQVVPHVELTFLDLKILVPEEVSVLCRTGENSYSWTMAKYLRPNSPTLAMVLGSALLVEPVGNVTRRQIPSVNCKQLISRDGSPMFIGIKREEHKNYSICIIVK